MCGKQDTASDTQNLHCGMSRRQRPAKIPNTLCARVVSCCESSKGCLRATPGSGPSANWVSQNLTAPSRAENSHEPCSRTEGMECVFGPPRAARHPELQLQVRTYWRRSLAEARQSIAALVHEPPLTVTDQCLRIESKRRWRYMWQRSGAELSLVVHPWTLVPTFKTASH